MSNSLEQFPTSQLNEMFKDIVDSCIGLDASLECNTTVQCVGVELFMREGNSQKKMTFLDVVNNYSHN